MPDSGSFANYGRFLLGAAGVTAVVLLAGCEGFTPHPAVLPEPMLSETNHSTLSSPTTIGNHQISPGVTLENSTVLAFASDRTGAGDIYVAQPGQPVVNLTNDEAADWDPTWSPTCSNEAATCRIAFTSHRSGDSEIWIMDDTGRNLLNVTQHPAWDYWPTWAPDGERIAFISERDGDPELFVQSVGEGEPRQLTFNQESDRLPAWSPAGDRIAFAAVRNGVEEIHVIYADGSHEQALTTWPLKGTSPAWSPDGRRLAFIGWDQEDRPGIYVMSADQETPEQIWQGTAWIGSLTWSGGWPQGEPGWFLFTSWQDENHEIFALPETGGPATRLTRNLAWDDGPDKRPGWETPGLEIDMQVTSGSILAPEPVSDGFAYGVNIADLGKAYLVRDLGFNWAKGFVNWETVEPARGHYDWTDPDNVVTALSDQGLHILARIHGTPSWARPPDTFLSFPPDDMQDFARFVNQLAYRYRGQIDAYEIWNEPNLNYEWGYLQPNPEAYAAMLKAAYTAIKSADPEAIVVSGGMSTTGGGSETAMGDLEFLRGMYAAGARGSFDVLGSHPYAYGHDPDYVDEWGLSLSRVAQQREVMLEYGDEATPVWITELGWVLHSNWNLVEHEAIGVTEDQQAEYLVRAYQKVRTEWPWVEGVFVFNLDFSSVPWYTAAEPMRWYAILNPDRTPRPAYERIKSQVSFAGK